MNTGPWTNIDDIVPPCSSDDKDDDYLPTAEELLFLDKKVTVQSSGF